jgi:hypothetical protein
MQLKKINKKKGFKRNKKKSKEWGPSLIKKNQLKPNVKGWN